MPRRKRAYGAGSVWKTDDPRRKHKPWIGQVYLGVDKDGKARFQRSYHETQTAANAWCDDRMREARDGELVGTGQQTLSDYLTDWLAGQQQHLGPNTYASYERKIRLHILPALGHLKLAKITPQHVQQMLNDLSAKGQAPATIRYCRAVLRAALDQALRWGTVKRNAAALTSTPHLAPSEVKPLSREDASRLLDVIRGHPLEALYTVALALGIRQGEALGLRWQDVDLDTRQISIKVNLQRIEGKPRLLEAKTPKSRRIIALPDFAVTTLRERRTRQIEERLKAGDRWQDWGLVFTTSNGTPINRHNLYRQWRGFLKTADIPHARFYDLRHTCASLLAARGLSLKEISELFGHSTIRVTADIYTHLFPEARRTPADAMDDLFGQQKARSDQN